MAWFRTWILADKLGYSEALLDIKHDYRAFLLQLAVKERIIPPAAVKILYDNTTDSCEMPKTLTKAAIDTYQANYCCCGAFMKNRSGSAASHPQYLSDTTVLFRRKSLEKEGTDIDICSCKKV